MAVARSSRSPQSTGAPTAGRNSRRPPRTHRDAAPVSQCRQDGFLEHPDTCTCQRRRRRRKYAAMAAEQGGPGTKELPIMQSWTKRVVAAGLALALGVAPSLGAEFDPRGRWQTTTGESRYQFGYCGNGKLCATLVWLNPSADRKS